jgi:hypothetical protein
VAEHLMNLAPATISSYDRSSFSFLPSGRRQGSICCPQLLAAGTVAHLEDGAADLDQIPRRHSYSSCASSSFLHDARRKVSETSTRIVKAREGHNIVCFFKVMMAPNCG